MQETAESDVPAYTLCNLLNKKGINLKDVAVIKSDTDGFDSDCIMSAGDSLANAAPFLFWENQIDTDEQYIKFLNMADYLYKNGYNNFFVFDNYGNYLCKTDYLGIKEICGYINRIRLNKSTYSFRYIDVLGCKNNGIEKCQKVIEEYLAVYG